MSSKSILLSFERNHLKCQTKEPKIHDYQVGDVIAALVTFKTLNDRYTCDRYNPSLFFDEKSVI